MAKSSGIGDRYFFHGTDISGDVSALGSISTQQGLLPATNLTSTTEERMRGLAMGQLGFTCYFNDALSQPILDQLPTTDVCILYARGTSIGSACFGLTAKQVNFDPSRGQDGSLTFAVDGQSNQDSGEWGVLLTAGQATVASSAATAPTGVVAAASSAFGGVGFLQYQQRASGTPTFLIEDSADTTDGTDGTWGTLLTFAGTGGASAFGERKTVTGTIEKGVRAATPTGTYSNAVFVIGFRRGEENDRENLA